MAGIKIKIPNQTTVPNRKHFARCLEYVADRSHYTMADAAIVATLIFEALADSLARNEPVQVPGFGLFHVRAIKDRGQPYPRKTYAAFRAARQLAAYVNRSVSEQQAEAFGARLHNYVVHNNVGGIHSRWTSHTQRHPVPNMDSELPSVALERVRAAVRSQAAKIGIDVQG